MTESHEQIEELLAGYVLRSLSGEDAAAADRVLAEHVPGCSQCRETLAAFQEVSGELALATPPQAPPEVLWPRLRRGLEARPVVRRGRSAGLWAGVAVAAVAVIGLVSWNTLLNSRLSDTEERQHTLSSAISAFTEPGSTKVTLTNRVSTPSHMDAAYFPGEGRMYLVGTGIPEPAEGSVYRLWLLGSEGDTWVADFLPEDGLVILLVLVDPTKYEEMVITEEPGQRGNQPSGTARWATDLSAAA